MGVLTVVTMKVPSSRTLISPCSLVEVYQRYGGTYCFRRQGQIVSRASKLLTYFAYFLTLTMEEIHASQMSVNLYHTIRSYISEDGVYKSMETIHEHDRRQ
jgi:hypothetical protein